MKDLNDSNSVPSDVIASLYQNVSRESELGAGDIHNIIDVLNVALDVQYDRLASAEDPTDYADKYTNESVIMMSDILDRPDSWFGIPSRYIQCTEVRFASFLSGGFITAIVVNPPKWKLAKRTSVHLGT